MTKASFVVEGKVSFTHRLRGLPVRVEAELKMNSRNAMEVYVELYHPTTGDRLDWRITRPEMAGLCRAAANYATKLEYPDAS